MRVYVLDNTFSFSEQLTVSGWRLVQGSAVQLLRLTQPLKQIQSLERLANPDWSFPGTSIDYRLIAVKNVPHYIKHLTTDWESSGCSALCQWEVNHTRTVNLFFPVAFCWISRCKLSTRFLLWWSRAVFFIWLRFHFCHRICRVSANPQWQHPHIASLGHMLPTQLTAVSPIVIRSPFTSDKLFRFGQWAPGKLSLPHMGHNITQEPPRVAHLTPKLHPEPLWYNSSLNSFQTLWRSLLLLEMEDDSIAVTAGSLWLDSSGFHAALMTQNCIAADLNSFDAK